MRRSVRFLVVLALTLTAGEARADLILVLSPSTQVGNPGDVLHFGGSLTNSGVTTVFLNGTSLSASGGLLLDDSPFFVNVPISLAASAVYTGPFFDVTIPFGTLPNTYAGTFSVLGGSSSATFDVLASQSYSAQVATSVTPEPTAFVLLLAGLPALLLVARRRSR